MIKMLSAIILTPSSSRLITVQSTSKRFTMKHINTVLVWGEFLTTQIGAYTTFSTSKNLENDSTEIERTNIVWKQQSLFD